MPQQQLPLQHALAARTTSSALALTNKPAFPFRRGLATNLYSLGVSDKVIQGILRHAQVSTTMNLYVKGVPKEAVAAMELLQRTCGNLAVNQLSRETSKLVN
jgi:site-specific recombinase XerD